MTFIERNCRQINKQQRREGIARTRGVGRDEARRGAGGYSRGGMRAAGRQDSAFDTAPNDSGHSENTLITMKASRTRFRKTGILLAFSLSLAVPILKVKILAAWNTTRVPSRACILDPSFLFRVQPSRSFNRRQTAAPLTLPSFLRFGGFESLNVATRKYPFRRRAEQRRKRIFLG